MRLFFAGLSISKMGGIKHAYVIPLTHFTYGVCPMQTLTKSPATCLAELRQSGMQLVLFIESQKALPAEDRNALFGTIGQISFIADGLSLAMCVESETDVPDFASLLENAERLNAMVQDLVSSNFTVH